MKKEFIPYELAVKLKELSNLQKQLNLYIKEKHTQEECIGFIDGYNKAKEEGVFTLEDMEKALSESFKAQQEGYNITTKEIINQIQQSKK